MRKQIGLIGLLCLSSISSAWAEESSDFDKELMDVENEVNALKERVFQSKATLKLLKEIIVQGAVSGAKATVWHKNELGSSYIIEGVIYLVDDEPRFSRNDNSPQRKLDKEKEFSIPELELTPGQHSLEVNVQLRGNGFGLFKYVNKYTFDLKATTNFTAKQGDDCQILVKIKEKKGFGLSFFDKPKIEFEPRCRQMSDVE